MLCEMSTVCMRIVMCTKVQSAALIFSTNLYTYIVIIYEIILQTPSLQGIVTCVHL